MHPGADPVNAINASLDSNDALTATDEHKLASAPERTIGQLLKAKRLALGWSLEAASKKTAIATLELQSIEETALNIYINQLAKLDHHIHIYANRLGVSLKLHQELIQQAKSSIRPKEVTPDLLNFIRRTQ